MATIEITPGIFQHLASEHGAERVQGLDGVETYTCTPGVTLVEADGRCYVVDESGSVLPFRKCRETYGVQAFRGANGKAYKWVL